MANDIFNMTEEAIRRQTEANKRANKSSNQPEFFENALEDAAAQRLEIARRNGEDGPEAATNLANELSADPTQTAETFLRSQVTPRFKRTNLNAAIAQERENQLRAAEDWREGVSGADMFGAAWQQNVTGGIIESIKREDFDPDPDFDYFANREELEQGLTPQQVDWIRQDSVSLDHAKSMREQALRENEQNKTIFAKGTAMGIATMLSGGLLDPAGWLAGAGVGKGLQLIGVGSRALLAEGRTAAALGSLVGEGAAGNVAAEAILEASGRRVDAADYAASAAFGAAFGLGLSPFVLKADRAINAQETQAQLKGIQDTYRQQLGDVYERAKVEAGPDATPDEIGRAAQRIQADEFNWFDRARTAGVDPQEQVLRRAEGMSPDEYAAAIEASARADMEAPTSAAPEQPTDGTAPQENAPQDAEPAADEAPARRRQSIDEFTDLNTRTKRERAKLAYGTDLLASDDPGKARFINEMLHRAERWVKDNPVDEARTRDLLGRLDRVAPYLATTAQNLLRSKHPLAKMYAQVVLENTTGAGGRRTTAALDKYMSERVYFRHVEQFETMYNNWRREQGGRWYGDVLNQRMPERFNRELTEYMARRNRGEDPEVDANIRATADMLERGYRQMADDQVRVGTPGAENIPASSAGYFSRRLSAKKVTSLSNAQQRALSAEFSRQLEDYISDPALRKQVTDRMVNRMRAEAEGGVNPSPNVHSPATAKLVSNALKDAGVKEDAIGEVIAKINTGGPAYTKSRLDLDLTARLTDPDSGQSFALADLYETNQLKLYRDYVRRVSGEVALAKRGIMGRHGLDLIRDAFLYGRDGQKLSGRELKDTLRAFDQTASEMLGTPYGTMTSANQIEWVNNLRMLTATSRLGGMAFTQFAEFANAVPALGIAAAFRGVKMMPRMLRELRKGQRNPILEDIERVGGEIGGEYKHIFPYADTEDMFVVSGEELGVFSRAVRGASRKMQFYNMWHYVAAAQTRGMAEQIVSKALKAVRDGRDDVMLDDMGIDADLRRALKSNLNRIAKFDERGDLASLDVSEMDPQITHRFATAVNRGAKQIIQGNYIGETGYWAHHDLIKLLTQFRTFSLTAMEKQWARVSATKGTVKALGYLLGMMSFALPIHMSRVWIASRGRDDADEYIEQQLALPVLARSLMNYSSLAGMSADVLDVGTGALGTIDNVFGTGLQPDAVRVRGRDGTVGSAIPAIGYANDLFGVLKDPTDLGRAVKQLPGGNLPYLVPPINALGSEDEKDDRL